MISPTSSPQYFANTTPTTATTGKSTLDKNAFLTLLVAQLKHQDPTSPLQPYELASQLAQFSSVEQLTQLNDAVKTQTQASQMAALIGQSSLSASLIGRQIEAAGDQVVVPSSGSSSIKVDIGGAGGTAQLTLKDDTGNTIATRDLGAVHAGTQTLTLPGDLPPGRWHYALDVKGADQASVSVTSYESGVVSAVEFKNGQIILHAGGLEIPLADIVRIEPAAAAATAAASSTSAFPKSGEPTPLGIPFPVSTALAALRGLTSF